MMDWGLSSQLTSGKLTKAESRNAMNKIVQDKVPTFGLDGGPPSKALLDIANRSKN